VVHRSRRSISSARYATHWLNGPKLARTEVLEFPGSTDGPWRRYIDPRGLAPFAESAEQKVPVPSHRNRDQHLTIGTVRYPRLVPNDEECAKHLARRTLTNLYNERPTWLDLAHRRLDETVFAAYGWPINMTDEQILERLLELNLSREPGK
jgi:hypothetical protein